MLAAAFSAGMPANAQIIDSNQSSTRAGSLPEIIVNGYDQQLPAPLVPASINTIDSSVFQQYSDASILQAVNTAPGVRMEERSPGSYRFGIRGSALEAPFGVRNVKVYYNGIPFTDPGGTTYLNALGSYNFSMLEIIKGPGSSLYGAGTGGVLLISSQPQDWKEGAKLTISGGSYGLKSIAAEANAGDSSLKNTFRYQHLESNGYRVHSALRRDVASWDASIKKGLRSSFDAHFLYSDLSYETPGALTEDEYAQSPEAARPAVGKTPGAIDSKAAIFQKMVLAGFGAQHQWHDEFSAAIKVYGAYVLQDNPNIRNYSSVIIPYFGGRAELQYERVMNTRQFHATLGTELQDGVNRQAVYDNDSGITVGIQSDQSIGIRQQTIFGQLSYRTQKWILTAGLSLNHGVTYVRVFGPISLPEEDAAYTALAPRLAVLYRITTAFSIFANVEKGFSPAAADAIAPTGSAINTALHPEYGWNYEAGVRGYAFHERLSFDASIFYFGLREAIVPGRDSAGGDYYVNAGSTKQQGLELALHYRIIRKPGLIVNSSLSYTASDFHYNEFAPLDKNYSGKQLPGIAPNTIAASISAQMAKQLSLTVSCFYSDAIPLDDDNTTEANSYTLLSAKLGYSLRRRHFLIDLFTGAENMLNEKYSLGNDLNAVNGRYFNAAAPISVFAGAVIRYVH